MMGFNQCKEWDYIYIKKGDHQEMQLVANSVTITVSCGCNYSRAISIFWYNRYTNKTS
jgi:hypothetical protein